MRWARSDRIISSSLDIDDVYRRLAPQARRLIRFDRMSVIVVDFDRGTASTAYTTGIEMPGWEPGVTLQLEGAAAVIRTGADLGRGIVRARIPAR